MTHAQKRALQHYEVELSEEDMDDIVQMIQKGKSLIIHSISKSIKLHALYYKDTLMFPIYTNSRSKACYRCSIRTFYSKRMAWETSDYPYSEFQNIISDLYLETLI